MRLFFGFDVTSEIRSQLSTVQTWLQSQGVRAGNWSRPELFHLTLLFIGDTSEENVSVLSEMGKATAAQASPFEIHFDLPGMFERNRILWYGIQEDSGMTLMSEVHRRITGLAKKEAFIKVDERPFRPHLTLARKLDTASIPLMRDILAQCRPRDLARSSTNVPSSDGLSSASKGVFGSGDDASSQQGVKMIPPVSTLHVNSICLFESRQINGRLMYPIVERYEFGS
ncbi:RNA 2',3'-cyclic phosphodiesterase [Alicyclobacillus ferrooxydans]|uniref:RNA 2',3'-cyclic phosphodiesterase n=1 Tax=Alicyclobacillus ferrooxydans TaxID=471514 RepID=A0A0N8PNP5_9BACL|nr:RNA 2',3'-cyclic phosphodiesterase [Alicyclobacillus ferrooxydans]KPV42101.1 hypothetical protein AN477_19420 [Alicyclobacillus ferrooxydans]